jgi:HSP20 family protein
MWTFSMRRTNPTRVPYPEGVDPRVDLAEAGWTVAVAAWSPPTDVFRTEEAVVVRVELAGASAAEIQARATEGELTVWGVRRPPAGLVPRQIDRMEIAFGPFERVISLPERVIPESAQARVVDGLLEVVLPLARPEPEPTPRRPEVLLTVLVLRS